MNVCAIAFPPAISEIDAAGLELVAGSDVPVPRIAQAPFALECRRTVALAFGRSGSCSSARSCASTPATG
jgi:flavin reductase (DIM6/NTAB) family NADH-FMN oxidoreductase RutF